MLKIESTAAEGPVPSRLSTGDRTLFRAAGAYVVALSGFLTAWLALKPGSHAVFMDVSSVLRFLGPISVVPFCLAGLWTRGAGFRSWRAYRSWAPIAMGASITVFAIGRGIAGVYDVFLGHTIPFPSAADAAWLGSYPLLFAGILLLPNKSISLPSATKVLLDVLLVLTGIATFSWYFILGPAILTEHDPPLARIVNVAYPIADLSLIGCMFLLWTIFRRSSLQRVIPLLGLGLFVLVGADSVREYQILHNAYAPGTLLDLGRPLAFMLIGLAAIAARMIVVGEIEAGAGSAPAAASRKTRRTIPRVWRYLLPYASVPAVVALMIYAARTPGYTPLEVGVYVAGAVLIELVFLHQFLDYRELIAYSNRNARLESLAAADPVTGLPNHRTVVSALDLEFERARRYGHPCTALFLDLDHFKALNDSYGHPSGDSALREFSSVVRTALRGIDILGRWGGEEFVAMLPETDLQEAVLVAERVRAAVAAHTFWSAGGAHVTCSIGVASYPEDAENRDELIEMADRAMYAAKRLGRNQVRTASDPAVAALEANTRTSSAREEAALLGTVEALAAVVEERDHTGGEHITEIASLATRLALQLGLDTSDAHTVGLAGRLHDIGKVSIPDTILNKPGRLSPEEWVLVRKHPAVGAAVVSRVPALRVLAPIIRAHHEHWDGNGYPNGLAGDAIPICARILSVADAYQAMTLDRPYRAAMTPQKALTEIQRCAGTQFDPAVVDALRKVLQADDATASVA